MNVSVCFFSFSGLWKSLRVFFFPHVCLEFMSDKYLYGIGNKIKIISD